MMSLDSNPIISAVVIPGICGLAGFFLLGPLGFFLGLVIPLVILSNTQPTEETEDK